MATTMTTIQTRIALKYDTLDNWNNSSIILKKGEAAIAVIDDSGNVKIKIGDGEHTFSQLPWVKAEAEVGDTFQEKLVWPSEHDYDKEKNAAATVSYVNYVLSGINGAMHFKGKIEGASFDEAINKLYPEGNPPAAGDVVLYGLDEYVYNETGKQWIQLDNEGLYQEKLSFTGEYNEDTNKVVTEDTLTDFMRFVGVKEDLPTDLENYVKNDVVLLQKDGATAAYILNETIVDENSVKEWKPLSTSNGSVDLEGYIKKNVVDGDPSESNKILTYSSLGSLVLFNCGDSTDDSASTEEE